MSDASPAAAARFLPPRLALGLCVVVLLQAALACAALAAPSIGLLSLAAVPHAVCAAGAILALLAAPLLLGGAACGSAGVACGSAGVPPADAGENLVVGTLSPAAPANTNGLLLLRSVFAAFWQALVMSFVLLVLARLTPLSAGAIAQAGLCLGLSALAAMLLSQLLPRLSAALLFVWAFALPVVCYVAAEVFLSTPLGAMGWGGASGSEARWLKAGIHALLSLSPLTAASGALGGALPDGSTYAPGLTLAGLGALDAALMAALWRRKSP